MKSGDLSLENDEDLLLIFIQNHYPLPLDIFSHLRQQRCEDGIDRISLHKLPDAFSYSAFEMVIFLFRPGFETY